MKRIIAVSVAMSLGAIAVQASIVTDNVSIAPSVAGEQSGLTFSLPTWDPSLGTLNSVELTLTPTLGNFGDEAINLSSSAQTISGATEAFQGTGTLQDTSGLSMKASYSTSSGTLTSPTFTAAAGFLVTTYGPGLPFVWTTLDSSATVTASGYAALGNSLAFTGNNPQFTSSGGDGSWAIGGYGNVGGNLEVDFSYTPVPEPTTMVAGVMLLLPFGASTLRMLRKSRAA
jgi:hypothetical protein